MKRSNEESKAYKSIIQNLLALKREAAVARPDEVKTIEAILKSLDNLSSGLQLPAPDIQQAGQSGTAQDNERSKTLVHAH